MTNKQDTILMCPPTYFTVDYVINPWMDGNEGYMDKSRAGDQWQNLKAAISKVADVVTMTPQDGLPDMVFTANAGVVYGDKAIASHFLPMERRGEEVHFKQWFRESQGSHLSIKVKGFRGQGLFQKPRINGEGD